MDVLLIVDILLVEVVDINLFLTMRSTQELKEVSLKLPAIILYVLLCILPDKEHLPHMAFALCMAEIC